MAAICRTRSIRLFVLLVALAASAAARPGAALADGTPLGQLVGEVEELVAPVGQTAAPPVAEVSAAATSAVEAVAPSVAETVRPADSPTAPTPPSGTPSTPSAGTTADATGAASAAAGAAVRLAEETVKAARGRTGSVTGTAPAPPPGVAPAPIPGSSTPDAVASEAAAATGSPTAAAADPPSPTNAFVPPPAEEGATGAPLPRWVAYVWPAVALTGSRLARLADSWDQAVLRLAAGGFGAPGPEQGIAGVHASGGRRAARDSSDPLFTRLPSSVGHAFSSVPTPALVYLGVLVLAVIAVALGVRRELVLGRRQGH